MPNPKLETYKNKATNTVYDLTDADAQSQLSSIKNGTTIDSFGDVETALSTKYDINDESQISILDYDYVPYYADAESATRKIYWTNIKNGLKSFFDDLYCAIGLVPSGASSSNKLVTASDFATAFPRSEQATTGAYNLFDINLPRTNAVNVTSPVTSSATGSSLTVSNSTAGTYKEADYLGLSFPKNADLKAMFGATVTSGKGKFFIDGSNDGTNWTNIATSDVITTNGNFTVTFNTGNYAGYRIRWYCTLDASTTGNVTYTDIMIVYASNTPSAYVPFAKTNKQLTDEIASKVDWSSYAKTGADNSLVYPYRETTKTSHKATFTDNGNGTITVVTDGATDADVTFLLHTENDAGMRDYMKSLGKKWLLGGLSENICLYISNYDGSNTAIDSGNGAEFTFTNQNTGFQIGLFIKSGTNISTPITIYPHISESKYSVYGPYAMTNKQLTDALTYKKGDSINLGGCMMFGYITNGKKALWLTLPLARNVSGTPSFSISSFAVRGDNEYVVAAGSALTSFTVEQSYCTAIGVVLAFKNTDDSTFNVTNNNTPVIAYVETGTLTLS